MPKFRIIAPCFVNGVLYRNVGEEYEIEEYDDDFIGSYLEPLGPIEERKKRGRKEQ